MLGPIPKKILTHSAVLKVCAGVDVWGVPTYTDTPLSGICVQPTHETRLTKENTEVVLSSVAFVDARLSSPVGFDFQSAQDESESNGEPLSIIYNGRRYVVVSVDALCDNRGEYHHTELGLK